MSVLSSQPCISEDVGILPLETTFSSITSQGLPFYGGNIRYKDEINVDQDCLLKVRVSDYKGAIVRIFLDGSDAGAIAYDPYILEIVGVKKGRHTIEFVLYGNRFNTFGSFHNCNRKNMYYEPIHWYSRGSDWCYEYKLKEMGILSSPVIQLCEME